MRQLSRRASGRSWTPGSPEAERGETGVHGLTAAFSLSEAKGECQPWAAGPQTKDEIKKRLFPVGLDGLVML